jgi:hypothetical protein
LLTALIVSVLLSAAPAVAGLVTWNPFTGVDQASDTNTVPYGNGTVTVRTDPLIAVRPGALPSFATTSALYSDIDTARFDILVVEPAAAQTGSPYRMEFDFTGTAFNGGGVINVGGLFYQPSRGAFTQFTVEAFEANDVTPFPLTDLTFEQHAYVGSGGATGADAPLSWDPATGLLTVAPGPTDSINSQFGFFTPARGRIGRIVFTAKTLSITSNGDQVYFGLGTIACGTVPALEGARCRVAAAGEPDVCTDPLFAALEKLLRKNTGKILAFLQQVAAGPSASKVKKLVLKADRKLKKLERKLATKRFVQNVPEACRTKLAQLIGEARALLQPLLTSG